MSERDEKGTTAVVLAPQVSELQAFEVRLVSFLADRGLPTANVFVSTSERVRVFSNVDHVIAKFDTTRLSESAYVSKFLAAAAAGLFDAALNYLWDETVFELRRRVAGYDLAFFFDLAVKDPERRKKLYGADDLPKVEDSELIRAANEIGLVSDLGLKHLDFIRYMRNWASAAHPNHSQVTGLQLVSWLETCVTEVIALPQSTVVGEIKKLLANIKTTAFGSADAASVSAFFSNLDKDRAHSLCLGFFGLYVDPASSSTVRSNIHHLAPRLWPRVDDAIRRQLGVRYAQYLASGELPRAENARRFLEKVDALAYIPDDLRAAEVQTALQDLLTAHRGLNNFYSEPALARRLATLMAPPATIPISIVDSYVLGIVEVFLTNGNGTAWNAEPTYIQLLRQLDAKQSLRALLSFQDKAISVRLQHSLCVQQFRELLKLVRMAVTAPVVIELIDAIERFPASFDKLSGDAVIRTKVKNMNIVMGLT